MTKEDFFNKVYAYESEEYAISFIVETLDDLHSSGNFILSDEILDTDPSKHKTIVLIALLVITFPAKKQLKNRNALFIKTKEHLLQTVGEEETTSLLIGLN